MGGDTRWSHYFYPATLVISFITSLDAQVVQVLALWRTPDLVVFFSWITLLGDAVVILVVGCSMAFVLWRHKRFEYKAGLATALGGSLLTSYVIKILVERARPDIALRAIVETGYSFPSMHAAAALATYGFLAYMIWQLMLPPRHRLPWIIVLSMLIGLIGFSRVYLGVHYPSDVVAGFAVGAACLWLGVFVTKRLKSRGAS